MDTQQPPQSDSGGQNKVNVGDMSDISGSTIIVSGRDVINTQGEITYIDQRTININATGHNTPELVAYLRALFTYADQLLQKHAPNLMFTTAIDTPDASALTFSFNFQASPVIEVDVPVAADERIFDAFGAAFDYHHGRLLLLGQPGAGKTTTLFAFTRDAAARRLEDPSAPLPIFAHIHTWRQGIALRDWAHESLQGIPVDGQPLLYLLDGLDELGGGWPIDPTNLKTQQYDPRVDFIRAVERQLSHSTSLVITTREKDYREIGQKTRLPGAVTLQPLADGQVQGYLKARKQMPLWGVIQADEALLEMARTPLLLALLTVAFTGKPVDLSNVTTRRDIFEKYIDKRFEHEKSRNPPLNQAETQVLLGGIATVMWRAWWRPEVELLLDKPVLNTIRNLKSISKFNFTPELDWALENIVEFGQKMHLLKQLPDGKTQFIHLALRDYYAAHAAIQTLQDPEEESRYSAALTLGKIGDSGAIPILLEVLEDTNIRVQVAAIEALGEIGNPDVIPILQSLLNSKDNHIVISASIALGKMGIPGIVDAILGFLKHEGETLRAIAATALGRIGDPVAVPGLLEALNDESSNVRRDTAIALGLIGDSAATPGLVKALSDRDEDTRCRAAMALSLICDPLAVPGLLKVLGNDKSDIVRSYAVEALGRIGDPIVVPDLIATLSDESEDVRFAAVAALKNIGHLAVPDLIKALDNKNEGLRVLIIFTLEGIGTPKALAAVEQWKRAQNG